MYKMFYECSSLNELNISGFNTKKVINMSKMFYRCSSLKKLDLSNFNTNNAKNMSYMFDRCNSLKELDISNFNINDSVNLNHFFGWDLTIETIKCSKELKNKLRGIYPRLFKSYSPLSSPVISPNLNEPPDSPIYIVGPIQLSFYRNLFREINNNEENERDLFGIAHIDNFFLRN